MTKQTTRVVIKNPITGKVISDVSGSSLTIDVIHSEKGLIRSETTWKSNSLECEYLNKRSNFLKGE